MKFHILKPETRQYWNEKGPVGFLRKYLSVDKKIYISVETGKQGNSWDYARIYIGTPEGKATGIYDVFPDGNYRAYPIYTKEDILKKFLALNIETPFEITVDSSHFTKKTIEI